MRKLETSDVFAACRLMKKLGLKEKLKTIAEEANEATGEALTALETETNELMAERQQLMDAIQTRQQLRAENGEKDIYTFLAGPFEMAPEEVSHLHLDELLESLKQMAVENNLVGFFKSAARLMR